MPWPAIPLSDRKTRKRLETFFAISGDVRTSPRSIIIDPTGVVLHCDATPLFLRYGAAAFPFTSDRIQFLDSEDDVIKKQPPSVKELLASSERDFLINNKGEQVPLHDLDKKVVGLYFSPCLKLQNFTRKLKMIYEELSGNMENFEIVLIYVHGWFEDYYGRTGEASFLHAFRTMPWLAVPFDDTNFIKGLQRLFQYPQELGSKPDYRLMIIGPHGNFMEPWGGNISLLYGVPAYPFNTCSAANLELERIKDLKLEMLWDLDAIFKQKNGSQVRFSQLVGKKIIVFFENYESDLDSTLRELKARYLMMNGKFIDLILRGKFRGKCHGLLAFDRDGSVVRRSTDPVLSDSMDFPFNPDGNLENEVLLEVEDRIRFSIEVDSERWL
ncbi:hypothetical protein DCAR_0935166 [Daucus carota subsp. sativus]|uniref:Uncharacterized protein n=1 Tax=Daucus carota subsp. sativus TaxID=79200 RepID=A0A175YIN1_DAUCS|nr:hypothetical protein DCAR_0935166 [Daucus carota subsp. sativus]